MHHSVDPAKSPEQRGAVRDVCDNQGHPIDEFAVTGGEVVINKHVVPYREKLSHCMRSDVSSAPGHQNLHFRVLLSSLPIATRAFCYRERHFKHRVDLHVGQARH